MACDVLKADEAADDDDLEMPDENGLDMPDDRAFSVFTMQAVVQFFRASRIAEFCALVSITDWALAGVSARAITPIAVGNTSAAVNKVADKCRRKRPSVFISTPDNEQAPHVPR